MFGIWCEPEFSTSWNFLREYLSGETNDAPHEHAVVFDEAQRAWDAKYGNQKFNRTASEPSLLLEIMGRHDNWCALVGLVGGGQEINTGENGVKEWGDALRSLDPDKAAEWSVHAPPSILQGDSSTAFLGLVNCLRTCSFLRTMHSGLRCRFGVTGLRASPIGYHPSSRVTRYPQLNSPKN